MLKKCSKCKINKELKDFGKKKYNKDGLNHYCFICERQRNRMRYNNPKSKEYLKYKNIFRNYGLIKEIYLTKLESQDYKCSICKINLLNNIHIDHCHKTGQVRDILCNICNTFLGFIEKYPDRITLLLKYIQRFNDLTKIKNDV